MSYRITPARSAGPSEGGHEKLPGGRASQLRAGKAHRLRTALTHAIAFRTWQSLCLVGQLHDDEAVELMAAAVLAAVQTPIRRPKRHPHPEGPRQPG